MNKTLTKPKRLTNKNLVLLLLLFFLSTAFSCKEDPLIPKPQAKLTITVEDVSCTEAWLELTTTNLQLPSSLTLLKDNTIIKTINLQTADTLLYIDSLLPNKTYSIQAFIHSTNHSSNEVSVATMDTTNHNFTWQSFEFGTIGSSVFYDVAIIDENNIWAVGEIMIADTSVNGYTTYNAVHWDGQEWELKKIGNQGGWACHTVFAFSATDIWFEGVIKWDGVNYSIHNNGFPKEPNGDGWLINKMWGSSSNDLYAVGNNGNIAHYNGGQWRRIESGTTLDIQDIWGSFNLKTNSNEIICIASNIYTNDGREVIQIENRTTKKLPTNGLSAYFEGIWFKPGRKYFVVGGGIHTKQNVNDNADWYRYPSGYINYHYSTSVRGNGLNDIIIGGSSGELLHFNGVSWKNYIDEITITNGGISGITIKERTVVSVGFNGNRAVVIVGKIN